jgi:hypothetical protein
VKVGEGRGAGKFCFYGITSGAGTVFHTKLHGKTCEGKKEQPEVW